MKTIIAIISLSVCCSFFISFDSTAMNWDRDAAQTEAGKIRSEYLSKAGTLPSYGYSEEAGKSEPTGETYHANCCGEADAYEADDVFIDAEGNTWAVLTCNDPDDCKEVPGHEACGPDEDGVVICNTVGAKLPRPPGSKYRIPPDKVLLNYEPENHTGHGWVYLSPNSIDGNGNSTVYCWAAPSGG